MTLHGIYWFFSITFTIILLIQLMFSFIGVDIVDEIDSDLDNLDMNFKILSMKSIIAFLAMFGWSGLALLKLEASNFIVIFISLCIGSITGLLLSLLVYLILKLKQEPLFDYKKLIGSVGIVYITIPGKRKSLGKVNILFNDKVHELKAMTDEFDDICFGKAVQIESVENNILIVTETFKILKGD